MGCHRHEGYDREPEELNSVTQQLKLFDQQKIDNVKRTDYLMKQADSASSNEEANQLNQEVIALKVAAATARLTATSSSWISKITA